MHRPFTKRKGRSQSTLVKDGNRGGGGDTSCAPGTGTGRGDSKRQQRRPWGGGAACGRWRWPQEPAATKLHRTTRAHGSTRAWESVNTACRPQRGHVPHSWPHGVPRRGKLGAERRLSVRFLHPLWGCSSFKCEVQAKRNVGVQTLHILASAHFPVKTTISLPFLQKALQ